MLPGMKEYIHVRLSKELNVIRNIIYKCGFVLFESACFSVDHTGYAK